MPTDTTGNQRGQHGFSDLREDQKQERQITAGALSLSPSFSFSSVNKGHMRITDLIDFSPFKISYKKYTEVLIILKTYPCHIWG